MRVVVTGASGNLGTSLLRALGAEAGVTSILGISRRMPELVLPKVEWAAADIAVGELDPLFDGADAVVHLAWAIQPSRDLKALEATNISGSRRVFQAVASSGAKILIHASSVGAYSPRASNVRIDETWPTTGIATSYYSRQKAKVERMLTRFEAENEAVRCVRLRPGLIFKRTSGSEIGRYFAGPFLPTPLLKPGRLPIVPGVRGLAFQAVHADDVGDAFRRALVGEADGAFNIAADPVLGSAAIAQVLRSRTIEMPARGVRGLANLTWKLRLQPTSPGWLDLAMQSPLMSCDRAARLLDWRPERTAIEALGELLEGLRGGEGDSTPPLAPRSKLRLEEIRSGVGARNP